MSTPKTPDSPDFSGIGITKEFLEEALNLKWGATCSTPIVVDKFTVSKGSAVGDNYTSALFAVNVWLKNHEKFAKVQADWYRTQEGEVTEHAHKPQVDNELAPLSFALKCIPETVARSEFIESTTVFTTEMGSYEKVTTEFIKFQEDLNLTKILKPDFLPFISGQALTLSQMKVLKETRPLKPLDNYIMMMDIRKHGKFQLRDRFLGFDLDHYKLVMEAHAQLHAISWAYKHHKKINDLRSIFPFLQMKQMFHNPKLMAMMGMLLKGHVNTAKLIVQNVLDGDEKIVKALDDYVAQNKLVNSIVLYNDYDPKYDPAPPTAEATKFDLTKDSILNIPGKVIENEEPWKVFIHGDAWSNNMMFRYDEATGRPVQVILLDLQLSREGDPMGDISYALYMGTTRDFREKHLESMLHVYYDKFTQVCRHLSAPLLPGFTWAEFNRRFHRAKAYGFAMALMLLPITLKKPEVPADPVKNKPEEANGKTGKDPEFEKLSPVLVERFAGVLQSMSHEGVL